MAQFIRNSIKLAKNIGTTGAFTETTKYVANEISKFISNTTKQVIVELGAGNGNISRVILNKMKSDSLLYIFEINKEFCDGLSAELADERITIINDSAAHLKKYLAVESVDVIISTLPLTIFPKESAYNVLSQCKLLLKPTGSFSQAYYSRFFLKHICKFFKNNKVKIKFNFPLAFIIHSAN